MAVHGLGLGALGGWNDRLRSIPTSGLLLGITLVHCLFLIFLGLTRHWSYLTSAYDLGMYDQSLWGLLNGAPFLSTLYDFGQPINRLGVHFNPILALVVPLYAIQPAAEWLVLAQALAISVTAWPLYLLGARVLSSEHGALLWTLAYLFNPFVLNAAAWDFQSIALAAPLMASAMLALELRRSGLLLAVCFVLLLVREHFGLAVAGFGVLWWLRQRSLVPGVLAVGMGALGFLLVLGVIMPALSPVGAHLMLSEDLGQLSRYAWLGASPGEAVHSLLRNPIDTVRIVVWDLGGWFYIAALLVPLAAIPLGGAEFLLPAGADLAANLLSANPMPRSLFAYHSVAIIPLLVVAGMHGARRLSHFDRYTVEGLGRLALFGTVLLAYPLLPLSLPGAMNVWAPLEHRLWPEAAVKEIRSLLPTSVSVSAQANVAPHFTQREGVWVFPKGIGQVDCVVLHLASPTARTNEHDPAEVGGLAHHLQLSPEVFLAEVEELMSHREYGPVYSDGAWLVLCKGASWRGTEQDRISLRLETLRKRWRVTSPRDAGL